ncbi:MAG: hypothetical protein ACKVS8_07645 [Phycisphaerales bacterium]
MGPRDLMLLAARVLEREGIDYCVVGSMASMIYGEYRSTMDVDVAADVHIEHIPALLAAFTEPDFYISEEGIRDALRCRSQFNAIHVRSGLKIDFMIPEDSPHASARMARAHRVEVAPGVRVLVAAPEDVILKKLEYYKEGGSDKHLRDIASMIKVSGETFDRAYLEQWVDTLGVREEWNAVSTKAGW